VQSLGIICAVKVVIQCDDVSAPRETKSVPNYALLSYGQNGGGKFPNSAQYYVIV
jgi:hypothetical protein